MRTQIYEHRSGIYNLEETSGAELRTEQTLDDGRFQLADNQAEAVMGDSASSEFAVSRPAASAMVTMEDVGTQPAGFANPLHEPVNSSSSASNQKRERENDDSSSDVAPAERQMGTPR